MKYATIVIVVLAILGVGGFYFYSQNQSGSDSMIKKDEAIMEKTEETMKKPDAVMEGSDAAMQKEGDSADDKMIAGGGQYVPFSQAAYDGASDKKRVLFFYANWCPTCKPADADFTANVSTFPDDVALFRVNYNDPDTDATEKALAQKYGITYQHTFVQVDDQGDVITKWNGGQTDKLLQSIK